MSRMQSDTQANNPGKEITTGVVATWRQRHGHLQLKWTRCSGLAPASLSILIH